MGTPILNVLVPGVGYVGVPAIKGEKGDPGKGLTILDYYDTEAALTAAVTSPEIGDVYGVGTAAPYDIYVYSASKGWVNNGQLLGAAGDAGVAPADYVTEFTGGAAFPDYDVQYIRKWHSGYVEVALLKKQYTFESTKHEGDTVSIGLKTPLLSADYFSVLIYATVVAPLSVDADFTVKCSSTYDGDTDELMCRATVRCLSTVAAGSTINVNVMSTYFPKG